MFVCACVAVACALCGCQQRSGPIREIQRSLARRETSRGEQLMARRQYSDAAKAFDRALSHDTDSSAAHAGLGRVRELEGDLHAAVAHYQSALKKATDRSDYAVALGDALRKSAMTSMQRSAMFEAAMRAYRHALSVDPTCSAAAVGMGICQRFSGQHDEAAESFKLARKLDPNCTEAYLQLGSLLESQSDFDRALVEYRRALRLEPENPRLHNAVAALSVRMIGEGGVHATLARQRALAHYRKSLEIKPDQPYVQARLAKLDPSYRTTLSAASPEVP